MDVTPLIPAGRQIVESYGDQRFRVSGVIWPGSILVLRDRTVAWPVASVADLTPADFAALFDVAGWVDVLLLGGGQRLVHPAPDLRRALRAQGVVVDAMDTGAACRTYNVLLAEDRRVAAALIAV